MSRFRPSPIKVGDSSPIVSESNQQNYEISGTCAEGITEFVIELPLPAQTVSCVEGQWTAEVDFSSSPDGPVEVKTNVVDPKNDKPIVLEFHKDTQPPVITQISLNGGKPYINTTTVPFLVQEQGQDLHEIRFSESATCDPAGAWVTGKSGTFSISSAEGLKTVFYQARDKAGNSTSCISTTVTTSSAVITLDITPPEIVGLADDTLVQPSKSWAWDCSEVSEQCQFRYVITQATGAVTLTGAFGDLKSVAAPSVDGTHYLHVQARDRAGNISATKVVSAIISTSLPSLSMVEEGRLYANTRTVDLVPKNHSLFDQVEVFDGASCLGAAESFVLASGTLQKTFDSDGVKQISYRFENTTNSSQSSCAQTSITVDTVRPTVVVASTTSAVTNISPIPVTVTFSEAVTGFAASDVTVTNGAVSGFTGSGTTYSFNVTPTAQGEVQVSLTEGVATDVAGNLSEASNVLTRTFDSAAPVITVTPPTKLVMKAADTLTWSFAMVDAHAMTLGAVDPTIVFVSGPSAGCTAEYTSDISNTLSITQEVKLTGCSGNGELEIRVVSSEVTDVAGNSRSSSTVYTLTVDNTRPVLSFGAPTPTEGKVGTVFVWRVSTTDKIPISLEASDIEIMGTTTSKVGCVISAVTKFDAEHDDVSVTGCENDGTVSIRVRAGAVEDLAGNTNLVSSNSATVLLKNIPKIISLQVSSRSYKDEYYPLASWNYDKTRGAELAKFEVRVGVCNGCVGGIDWLDIGTDTTWSMATTGLSSDIDYYFYVRITDVNGKSSVSSAVIFKRYWAAAENQNYAGFALGTVNSSIKDSAGGRIIAGDFTEVVTSSTSVNGLVLVGPNGGVDPSFKIQERLNGIVTSYQRQGDGKFIVTGSFSHVGATLSSGIARFNPDGSYDGTFAIGEGFTSSPTGAQILADGKILVYGHSTYDANYRGTPLKSFVVLSATGELVEAYDLPANFRSAVSIHRYADGKLLVSGVDVANKPTIYRLNSDFTLDETFEVGTSDGGFSNYLQFTVLPNGKIVIFGMFTKFNGQDAGKIVRLQANGALDNSFQAGTGFTGYVYTTSILSDASSIYLSFSGGFAYNGQNYTNSGSGLIRMNHDGTINPLVASGYSVNSGIHILDGNGILVFGKIIRGTEEFSQIRILADGSLDAAYLSSKVRYTRRYAENVSDLSLTSAVKTPEGVVIWGMDNLEEIRAVKHIARFAADGSFDQDFAANVGTGFSGVVHKMIRDSDGRILVAGGFGAFNGDWNSYGVIRLFEDGTRDTSFTSPNYYSPVVDMALLPNGQIALAAMPVGADPDILVLPANGSTTFTRMVISDTSSVAGATLKDIKITNMLNSSGTVGIAVALNFAQYDTYLWRFAKDEEALLFWVSASLSGRTNLLAGVETSKLPVRVNAMYESSQYLRVIASTPAEYYDYLLGYLPTASLMFMDLYKYGGTDWTVALAGSGSGSSSSPVRAYEAKYISSSMAGEKFALMGRVDGWRDYLVFDGKTIWEGSNLHNSHVSVDSNNEVFFTSTQGFYHSNKDFHQKPMCILSL